ncbi:MAG TPA: NmrA family NAD(P)-binding protein [Balneolaceae bacterium]|nr:NmrA family NAD(P)-binding protein [Balneolaceae bacterium]
MKENYLIIGGTGKTGRKVVANLEDQGHNVRIGSRSAVPSFEWEDPSNWMDVLKDIDKMYVVFYPDLAVPGAYEAIQRITMVAKAVGVKKVVLLSGKGEKEAERCEDIIANSGLDYTLVRASWFNQNFSESFFVDPVLSGEVALPMPEAQIPFVDTDDIADVVTAALNGDQHNGKTYEVTGPRKVTFAEAIAEISKATGRPISYHPITLKEYTEIMKNAGLPADYIWLFEYLFREVLGNPNNQVVSNDVERVLGRKAKDFSEFASETAETGVWDPSVSKKAEIH